MLIPVFIGQKHKYCKARQFLLVISKETCLEVRTEKTICTTKSQHTTGDRSFQNVAKFKYMGITLTSQNYLQIENKIRLNSRTACYHLANNFFLFSCLLSKDREVKLLITLILPVV
jgi:hypothetical protein